MESSNPPMWNVARASEPLGPHYDQVLDILSLAFETDPGYLTLSRVAGEARPRYIRPLMRSTLELHLAARQPVFVVEQDGEVLGVSLVEEPGASLPRLAAAKELVRLLRETTPIVAFRAVRGLFALMRERPREPHYYLVMLAVDPRVRGRGLARALLEDLHTASGSHPESVGVGLDTSNPRNVKLYEHFGYRTIARLRVSGVETWCMFRPSGSSRGRTW
jgi:ribosomal protein S18 acetylase RimI-like enzyme